MEIREFEKMVIEECEKNKIDINGIDIEKFYKYMLGIINWNEKINVTAITDEKEFLVKHFMDSLTINCFLSSSKNVLDIGTGAGFPRNTY